MAKHTTKRTPPLFKLPPELRNTIYHLILAGPQQTIMVPAQRPALLKVCRQIAAEASPIYCSLNDFHASVTTADVTALSRYITNLGTSGGKAVASLTIALDLEAERELERTSKYGGAGVLNYPRWRWADSSVRVCGLRSSPWWYHYRGRAPRGRMTFTTTLRRGSSA